MVGTGVMKAPDPGAKLRDLLSRPLVKVCGLTRQEDVDAAVEAGADMLGFILVEKSPRRAEAVLDVPDTALSVAVFVGEAEETDADLVQLYPDDGGTVRGRRALILRKGEPVALLLDQPWQEQDPAHWKDAAAADERTVLAGRPTPLPLSERFAPGKRIYLKREDLLHTGAHKLNNALGQIVLARRLGKHRIVAETGAGQHGVATATVCAKFGLECVVYMGEEDIRRQKPNVDRMGLLGAEVRPVDFGTKTLKEATSEAIRDWITNVETTHYLIGSCVGPAPYPEIVRDLQRVIGDEAREQIPPAEGRLPESGVACVGGGSDGIGLFSALLEDERVKIP